MARMAKVEELFRFQIETGDTVIGYRETQFGHIITVVINSEGKTIAVSLGGM